MQPPQPPRGPYPGPAPSGGPFGRGNYPGMGVGGPPLPAPTTAPSRGPGSSVTSYPATGGAAAMQTGAAVSEVPRGPTVRINPMVQYYRRMRTGRLHRLVVQIVPDSGSPAATPPPTSTTQTVIGIQPIIPGAMVTPTISDVPMRTGGEVVFQVLPLIAGKLPDARLELVISNRRFNNALLPMKAARGRLTKLMWLFTLLATLLFAAVPFDAWEPYRRPNRSDPRKPLVEFRGEQAVQEFLKDRMRHLGVSVPENQEREGPKPGGQDKPKPGGDQGGDKISGTLTIQQPLGTITQLPGTQQKLAEGQAAPGKEDVDVPPPGWKGEKLEWHVLDYLYYGLYRCEPATSQTYHVVCAVQRMPLGVLYVFGGLFLLTILCWFVQRPAQSKVQGAVLEMKV